MIVEYWALMCNSIGIVVQPILLLHCGIGLVLLFFKRYTLCKRWFPEDDLKLLYGGMTLAALLTFTLQLIVDSKQWDKPGDFTPVGLTTSMELLCFLFMVSLAGTVYVFEKVRSKIEPM